MAVRFGSVRLVLVLVLVSVFVNCVLPPPKSNGMVSIESRLPIHSVLPHWICVHRSMSTSPIVFIATISAFIYSFNCELGSHISSYDTIVYVRSYFLLFFPVLFFSSPFFWGVHRHRNRVKQANLVVQCPFQMEYCRLRDIITLYLRSFVRPFVRSFTLSHLPFNHFIHIFIQFSNDRLNDWTKLPVSIKSDDDRHTWCRLLPLSNCQSYQMYFPLLLLMQNILPYPKKNNKNK